MNPPISPASANLPVSFLVEVNGQPLPDAVLVFSIDVEQSLVSPTSASITTGGADAALKVGDQVVIRAGRGQSLTELFYGQVRQCRLQVDAQGTFWTFACTDPTPPRNATGISDPVLTLTLGENVLKVTIGSGDPENSQIGTIDLQGQAPLLAGDALLLAGFPAPFGGEVVAATVKHRLAAGNWITTVGFGENEPPPPPESIELADAHGNRIRLDAQGLALSSATKVSVNGNAIALTATDVFQATSQGTAELSAGTETIVRGAMVRIN